MPTILELFRNKQIISPSGLSETAEKGADSQKKAYKIDNVATDGTNISGPIRAFNTLQLKDGKTAAFTTNINNRAFTQIDTPNIFLKNTSFPLVNKLKKTKLAQKDGESFLEEELTGLRPLQLLSQLVLYGTDIVKMTAREARSTEKMKLGTYSYETAVQIAKQIQPKIYTPTSLFLNDEFRSGKVLGKPGLFSKLRGTPDQLLLKLALHPIDALKKLLSPNGTKLNTTKNDPNTKIVVRNSNGVELLSYNTLVFDEKDDKYTNQLKKDANIELKDRNDLAGKLNSVLSGLNKKELTGNGFVYDIDAKKIEKNNKSKYKGEVTFPSGEKKNYRYTGAYNKGTDARGDKVFKKDLNIESYRGMQKGNDYLNSKTILDSNNDLDSDYKNKDFATLKFESVATKKRVRFRATVSGLTETFTPSWESNKFVGNPFNFYTYNSIERSVTFTFKVFSLNYEEHKRAWIRLSFLSSLVYPQSYVNKNYVTPPFIKFTLGDMYKDKSAFIESLTYTIDDNTTWETGLEQTISNQNELITQERKIVGESYILPKIIEVAMTLKLVETPSETYDLKDDKGVKVLYGFSDSALENNVLASTKDAPYADVKVLENGSVQKVAGTENASTNTSQPAKPTTTSTGTTGGGSALGTSENNPSNPFNQASTSVTRTPIGT